MEQLHKNGAKINFPCDQTAKSKIWNNNFEVTIHGKTGNGQEHECFDVNCVHIYTDGSVMNGSAGAGWYCDSRSWNGIAALDKYATIFQAEIFVIYSEFYSVNLKEYKIQKSLFFLIVKEH